MNINERIDNFLNEKSDISQDFNKIWKIIGTNKTEAQFSITRKMIENFAKKWKINTIGHGKKDMASYTKWKNLNDYYTQEYRKLRNGK
jgi:hypothetical protein